MLNDLSLLQPTEPARAAAQMPVSETLDGTFAVTLLTLGDASVAPTQSVPDAAVAGDIPAQIRAGNRLPVGGSNVPPSGVSGRPTPGVGVDQLSVGDMPAHATLRSGAVPEGSAPGAVPARAAHGELPSERFGAGRDQAPGAAKPVAQASSATHALGTQNEVAGLQMPAQRTEHVYAREVFAKPLLGLDNQAAPVNEQTRRIDVRTSERGQGSSAATGHSPAMLAEPQTSAPEAIAHLSKANDALVMRPGHPTLPAVPLPLSLVRRMVTSAQQQQGAATESQRAPEVLPRTASMVAPVAMPMATPASATSLAALDGDAMMLERAEARSTGGTWGGGGEPAHAAGAATATGARATEAFQGVLQRTSASDAVPTDPTRMPVNDAQFPEQLVRRMLISQAQHVNALRIQLKPAELGHLDIQMRTQGDQVNLIFTAQQAATRELLESYLPNLRQLLGDTGVQLGSVDVRSQGESTPDHGLPQHSAHGSGQQVESDDTQARSGRAHTGLIDAFA